MYPDLSPERMAEKWRDIQLEAGTNWRLPIYAELCPKIDLNCTSKYTVALGNAHPEIPLTFIVSRGGQTILWNTTKDASVNSMSRKCFLQTAAGNLLSVDGVAMNMNTTLDPHSYSHGGIFRPCVTKACAAEAECPLESLYKHDGQSWVTLFKEMKDRFTRPVNRLIDDGEILGVWNSLNHALDMDPVMVRDYDRVKIPRLSGGNRDWRVATAYSCNPYGESRLQL